MNSKILILSVILLNGCSTSIKKLNADQFVSQAKQIEQINSATWTLYIGTTRERVYLEYQRPPFIGNKPKTIVYWTELKKLDPDLQEILASGESPWTTWMEQKK